jgi:protein-disulfide isomerase
MNFKFMFRKDKNKLDPKMAFLFGLVSGVAILAVIISLVLLVKSDSSRGGDNVAKGNTNVNTDPAPIPSQPTPTSQVAPVSSNDYIRGNKDAKVTIIEYSDFECPFCSRFKETIDQVLEAYPNDVRLVYRHFPLSFHQNAQKAAEAAECAGEQGKFYEMHDEIFKAAKSKTLSEEKFKSLAVSLGLNASQFNSCLDDGKYASKIRNQMASGSAAGVTGTPGTFINGELVKGAVPFSQIKAIIDKNL